MKRKFLPSIKLIEDRAIARACEKEAVKFDKSDYVARWLNILEK